MPNDREPVAVSGDPARRNRIIAIAIGALLVLGGIVAVLVMTLTPGDSTGAPGPEPSTSASDSPSPTPEPGETTDDPSATPTPGPTEAFGQPANPPVAIDEQATPQTGVTAVIDRLESVDGEAVQPGDIAGPSVRFRMTVTNDTAAALDLTLVTVNAYYGADDTPAGPLTKPGGEAFPDSVAAGSTATGVFVFTVPEGSRDRFTVTLDIAAGTPLAVFTGPAPRG